MTNKRISAVTPVKGRTTIPWFMAMELATIESHLR